MDWRVKKKSIVFAFAARIGEDGLLERRQIHLPKEVATIADVDLSQYDIKADEVVDLTEWRRPGWEERNLVDKTTEIPVELPGDRIRLASSPAKTKTAYLAALLVDWTFANDAGEKHTLEELVDVHPLILEDHIHAFAVDLKRL